MVENKPKIVKGVNVKLSSPEGQKFELQFHTRESFDLKNGDDVSEEEFLQKSFFRRSEAACNTVY
jgi:hypothetical protein